VQCAPPATRLISGIERQGVFPRPANQKSAAARLRDALHLVDRLTPYHGDPERFFVCRAEAVAVLEAIARSLEAAP